MGQALELQMEAVPETPTYDAPRGQSGIDRQVPWIPADGGVSEPWWRCCNGFRRHMHPWRKPAKSEP